MARLAGARVALQELGQHLPWDSVPSDADPKSISVVVLSAWRPFRMDRVGDRLFTPLPLDVMQTELRRWLHTNRCWYYLECRRDGVPWRSAIDWFDAVEER